MVKMTMTERVIKVETILEEHIKQGNLDHSEIMEEFKSIKCSYAGKWVEKMVVGIILGGVSLIVALIVYM